MSTTPSNPKIEQIQDMIHLEIDQTQLRQFIQTYGYDMSTVSDVVNANFKDEISRKILEILSSSRYDLNRFLSDQYRMVVQIETILLEKYISEADSQKVHEIVDSMVAQYNRLLQSGYVPYSKNITHHSVLSSDPDYDPDNKRQFFIMLDLVLHSRIFSTKGMYLIEMIMGRLCGLFPDKMALLALNHFKWLLYDRNNKTSADILFLQRYGYLLEQFSEEDRIYLTKTIQSRDPIALYTSPDEEIHIEGESFPSLNDFESRVSKGLDSPLKAAMLEYIAALREAIHYGNPVTNADRVGEAYVAIKKLPFKDTLTRSMFHGVSRCWFGWFSSRASKEKKQQIYNTYYNPYKNVE
jgi:hypothetical protein